MRRTSVSQTGTGSTPLVILNRQMVASVAVIVSGTVDYTVQITYDDVNAAGFTPGGATWFDFPSLDLVGATTNQRGVIDYPIAAIRTTVNSGSGSVTMVVLQDERAG